MRRTLKGNLLKVKVKMYILILFCLVFFEEECASVIQGDVVCTDFKSYAYSNLSNHCYHNPDLESTPQEINNRYGFDLSEHTVVTEDGYILTIFRVGLKNGQRKKQTQPVILQHGVLVDSRSWFISGNNSLAFVIARNGFDLWIPNLRGTDYSRKHLNSSISQKEYWNFSFHEVGVYDLPAIIDYVFKSTKRSDMLYIGHSMGCTAFLVYSSMKEEHAQKYIKGVLYIAPVANFNNPPPILQVVIPFANVIKNALDSLNIYAIGLEIRNLISAFGYNRFPTVVVCHLGISIAAGFVVDQIRPELYPLILKLFPTELSVNTMLHFAQIIRSHGRFQQFDYGIVENMKKYNSVLPPQYEIERIKIPAYIFTGSRDLLAEIRDVHRLYDHIKAPKNMNVYKLSHLDFVYGKNVTKVYQDILDTLNILSNNDIK